MATRVNSASINNHSTAASAITASTGVAVAAGDLIIVGAYSNGTHAANGMSVKDSVNNTNYTTILEVDNGGASSRWLQCFVYKTPKPMSSSDTFTFHALRPVGRQWFYCRYIPWLHSRF
jgi:hypothetical protein